MRIAIGILGAFGVGVTVAIAQQPVSAPARPRAVTLLPPVESSDLLPIARGVADDLPAMPNSSPAIQPRPATGLWANGFDPNLRPASGIIPNTPAVPVAAPSVATPDDPSAHSRGLEKVKGAFNSNQPQAGVEQPNANSPYRGATANGSAVYAGPPTWRWYGWGSVTPGANPNAPTGQYPKASANWYSITGATPGAFPVPVTTPMRTSSGTEPPSYVTASMPRYVQPGYNPPQMPYTPPQMAYSPPSMPTQTAVQPAPVAPAIIPVPTNAPPIAPPQTPAQAPTTRTPTAELPIQPVPMPPNPSIATMQSSPSAGTIPSSSVPLTPNPPIVPMPVAPSNGPPSSSPGSQTVGQPTINALPTISSSGDSTTGNALPVIPVFPAQSGEPTGSAPEMKLNVIDAGSPVVPVALPGTVPASVAEKELNWQSKPEATSGPWVTPGKPQPVAPQRQPKPAAPTPGNEEATPPAIPAPAPGKEQSNHSENGGSSFIARGQMGENKPDPVVTLIQRLCDGRAGEVDVRWTGSRRLSVCFECRGVAEAQKLVKDISARPEFVPYRIDFCVLVK